MESGVKRIDNPVGFQAICAILNELDIFYPKSENESKKFIFRGVTSEHDAPFIRSGAAVRLSKFCEGYRYVDYINYIKGIITNARQNFPEYYVRLSDIEVLADIQHKGGATCLVDFSKNMLISLWFACKGEYDKDGILYCYDTINDMVYQNRLSVLTEQDNRKPIENLLVETRKCANFKGKYSHKFWMWYPSCLNDRISRQDSVFIFGLEKFNINDHGIKKIVIAPEAKKDILYVLEHCFNISAITIYHDADGYADSHGKLNDILSNSRSGASDPYNDGFENLIAGNFGIALDFFNQCEAVVYTSGKSKEKSVEIAYSKAVCYKHLGDKENAVSEYTKSRKICLSLLGDSEEKNEYWYTKSFKAYNDELYLLYDLGLYESCIACCDEIIRLIDRYNQTFQHSQNYDIRYCKMAKIELYILKILNEENANMEESRRIYTDLLNVECCNGFYSILLLYFGYFGRIYFSREEVDVADIIRKLEQSMVGNMRKKSFYSEWNFSDIKKALQQIISKTAEKEKIERLTKLQFLTSRMVDIQNIVHNRYLNSNSDKP